METEGALVPAGEVRFDLTLARAPKQVLSEAQDAAKALQSVIAQSPTVVKFNGKNYLAFEHWQTCGRFYGVTARVTHTEYIEIGEAKGFLAKAEAINTQTGAIISSAESMCMNDEQNWNKKPLFQLRSMAQTRACAKSLRNCLAWVVVLAGFEPSVAEEMTGDEHDGKPAPIPAPKPKAAPSGDCISEKQADRFYAIGKGAGKSDDEMQAYLQEKYGVSSTKAIPSAVYEGACAWAGEKSL